ncbi:PhoH family protein [Nissabacter sp. SGAir0207]|uniref:PhoH family protein n=1 Tax=Nissabacter sp. SGAir0207 TaxID=2126321 RepID=UPI00197CCED2|nr:PhoH family protein [Nissabacter sp. SGAir0207]
MTQRNSLNVETQEILLEPADNQRLLSLCGPFDDNIKHLERRLGIEINHRDNQFKLVGKSLIVNAAIDILRHLYVETAPVRGEIKDIDPEQIHLAIKESRVLEQSAESVPDYGKAVTIRTKRGVVKPRTPNQAQYVANILDHDITFGIGPAGTGKTYLAVAAAVDALERQEVRRILLTRPAVEAGEKLGFLPGDLSQKVDPYLRPLYDALFEMLGFERVEKLIERNVIEVAPLAYMRGRTLNDAFIILDESQNTTIEQMKMFLTRIGFNSKAVITGDVTQIDLPRNQKSGLRHAIEVLANVEEISFNFFHSEDVVRHPVVARVVIAYEAWEAEDQKRRDAQAEQRRRETQAYAQQQAASAVPPQEAP